MAEISLEGVTKVYPDGTEAVSALDLRIRDGEFVVLVGPSGCGKTSVLRMVAGLEEVSGGSVRIGGHVVNHLLPNDRDIAMVFQNYALYPHMSVFDNMAFGLRHSNLDAKLRVEMRAEIARIQRDLSVTTVYVTHDQTEAMTMDDRVAVMRKGLLHTCTSRSVWRRGAGRRSRRRSRRRGPIRVRAFSRIPPLSGA
jgi:ABC-type sugar transport system ATPase subunit